MLVKLTHPQQHFDLWIDLDEIVVMERYDPPKTQIITEQNDRPRVTALVLRSGKTLSCKETPEQINLIKHPITNPPVKARKKSG